MSTPDPNFASIFNAALETYKRRTKKDLASHPLLPILQPCDSPEAILTVLREQIPAFRQPQSGDGFTKWVTPTVNFLSSICNALGGGVGQVNIGVFPREIFFFSNTCFSGIPFSEYNLCGHCCPPLGRYPSWFSCATYFNTHDSQAAKDVSASQDKLVDIFNRIERYFRRLEIYIGITPTTAMTETVIKIMVEVLTILAIATKEVKSGRLSELMSCRFTFSTKRCSEKYIKKLTGNTDIEDSLQRLDKLTLEEAQMASAELLRITHGIEAAVQDVRGSYLFNSCSSFRGSRQLHSEPAQR